MTTDSAPSIESEILVIASTSILMADLATRSHDNHFSLILACLSIFAEEYVSLGECRLLVLLNFSFSCTIVSEICQKLSVPPLSCVGRSTVEGTQASGQVPDTLYKMKQCERVGCIVLGYLDQKFEPISTNMELPKNVENVMQIDVHFNRMSLHNIQGLEMQTEHQGGSHKLLYTFE